MSKIIQRLNNKSKSQKGELSRDLCLFARISLNQSQELFANKWLPADVI